MTSAVPPAVLAYFGDAAQEQPVLVAQEFRPGGGWVTRVGADPIAFDGRIVGRIVGPQHRKRITPSWARKLRAEGVTAVALSCGGRLADFTLSEILRRPPRERNQRP